MAVGTFSGGGGAGLLGESRTGGTWTPQTPLNVTGQAEALNGISCTSPGACVAVGSYFDGTNTVPLAEIWNGSGWSVVNPVDPSGASDAELTGVSCTPSGSCMAVGFADHSTLTETWNGSSWTIRTSPNVSGATSSKLNGVSCPAATACIAVGDSSSGASGATLAEAWNGSSWTIQSTPNPLGFSFNQLNAVSCTSPSACTAVGLALAERWNGTSWTLQKVPAPAGHTGRDPDLAGVSCTTATSCAAVGSYFVDGVLTGTAEAWNGTNWRSESTPIATSNDSSSLSGVSCNAATSCTAAGDYHDPTNGIQAWIEVFALHWHVQSAAIPSGAIATDLDSVSCRTLNACSAIGSYETASDFDSLAEGWDGSGWTFQATPNPTVSNPDAVSCSAPTACTAVGDSFTGTDETLAERWNGTNWTSQTTPNPTGASASFLLGVSCPSATACMAVGFYRDGSGNQHDLAESWDGANWTILSVPDPASGSSFQLNGVSCPAASSCQAVGSYSASGVPASFATVWNGTSWTLESVQAPSGGGKPTLAAVSCVTAKLCFAGGNYYDGSKQVPLAESWNGTSWSAQAPSVPSVASTSGFEGISCRAANFCIGVGWRLTSAGDRPLAERETASGWVIQSTPLPSGAQSGYFQAVSCPALSGCEAVGNFDDSTATEAPLAEQLS